MCTDVVKIALNGIKLTKNVLAHLLQKFHIILFILYCDTTNYCSANQFFETFFVLS